jgi:hypothetical protein
VAIAEAASAVAKILLWIVGKKNPNDDLTPVGGHASALQVLLDPRARYRSLAAVARDAGVSRAIISRWLLDLRDQYQIGLNLRGNLIRENCRQAQHRLVDAGKHVSVKTRKIPNMKPPKFDKNSIRSTRLAPKSSACTKSPVQLNMRKRISEHVDLLIYDLDQPLRKTMSNLAHALLNARRQWIEALFLELIGLLYDHGLPVDVQDLTRVSKPVVAVQQLANWIHREARPTAEEELVELRSEVPRRWLAELRAGIAQEQPLESPRTRLDTRN